MYIYWLMQEEATMTPEEIASLQRYCRDLEQRFYSSNKRIAELEQQCREKDERIAYLSAYSDEQANIMKGLNDTASTKIAELEAERDQLRAVVELVVENTPNLYTSSGNSIWEIAQRALQPKEGK